MSEKYDKIKATLDKKLTENREKLVEQRIARIGADEVPDEGVLFREEGMALDSALTSFDQSQGRLGQMELACLWKMHTDHQFELSFEAENAVDYVEMRRETYSNYDYVKSLAQVIDTIFTYIEMRKTAGNPVLDDETQVEITVEELIGADNLVSKLKEQSFFITNLKEEADRVKMISAIARGLSRSKIAAIRAEIEDKETDESLKMSGVEVIDPKTKKTKIKIDVNERQLQYVLSEIFIASVEKNGDTFEISFEGMEERDVRRLKRAFGKTLELHQSTKKPIVNPKI